MTFGTVQIESARRVSACVTELLRKQPFFGSLALRLPLTPDASRKTLASDGRAIRYSPRWIAETPAHGIEAAIARVVLACALKHHTRRGDRDAERWQTASQLVTHALLRDSGFTLPPEAEAWEGVSVEEAYDRLPNPDGDGSQGSPSADGQHSSSGTEAAQGASATSDDAQPSHDPVGTGEVMDAPACGAGDSPGATPPSSGGTTAGQTAEEQAWDEAMHQAASLARAEGKLPGAIGETVRGAHIATLDWRALLRRHMTDAARSDYSWSVPNRRFIDAGLYLPSIRSDGIGTVAVIVDTSGSLPRDALAAFWTEVREIAAEVRPERVVVLQVDAAVRDAADYAAFDLPDEIKLHGRGGTDFRPGFDWLDERGIRPGVCLYFTDMRCSRFPDSEPDFPVLWIDWSDPRCSGQPTPWGEHIPIGG